tara:strand:- start:454 stop:741 length:288 start_codon:yes stop_codon:yes gene_type:complete
MSPFIPHFSSECLSNIEQDHSSWPVVSENEIVEESINFVVQINGKKRALIKVKRDTNEQEIIKQIKSNEETSKLLIDYKIQKTIFVSNRLINIIL